MARIDAGPARIPRPSVAASMITCGVPGGIGVLNPRLGEIVGIIELLVAVAITVTIMSAALFGKPDLSDRAFRLLRWIRSRPAPPAPTAKDA